MSINQSSDYATEVGVDVPNFKERCVTPCAKTLM